MLGSDQNVSSVLVLAVWVALPYDKETLPIDVLTAFPHEIPCFAILMCLQESSLVLDCVRYVLFGLKRKFRPHFPFMLGRSTAYGRESLPINVLTAVPDEIPCFAILIYLQKHSLELDRVCYAWFRPKRKFRPHSGCVGSTTVRQGNPRD